MGFTEKMLHMKELEKELLRITEEIKGDVVMEVAGQPFNGSIICDGRDGKPVICTIRFSELRSSKNWTPEYYMPVKQADAVRKRLSKCSTAGNVLVAIKEMLRDKRVKMGPASNDYIYLNEKTLRILRESEIGRFLANNENKDNEKNI